MRMGEREEELVVTEADHSRTYLHRNTRCVIDTTNCAVVPGLRS